MWPKQKYELNIAHKKSSCFLDSQTKEMTLFVTHMSFTKIRMLTTDKWKQVHYTPSMWKWISVRVQARENSRLEDFQVATVAEHVDVVYSVQNQKIGAHSEIVAYKKLQQVCHGRDT